MKPGGAGTEAEGLLPGEPVRLMFATGKLGCILPLMAGTVLFCGAAAVRLSLLETHGRHAWLADAVRPMMWQGINIPALLLTFWLLWETARFGWRWADRVAVESAEHGLVFTRRFCADAWCDGAMVRRPGRALRAAWGGGKGPRCCSILPGEELWCARWKWKTIMHRALPRRCGRG